MRIGCWDMEKWDRDIVLVLIAAFHLLLLCLHLRLSLLHHLLLRLLPSRDVAHISTCDDGCLALADLLGWKVSYTISLVTVQMYSVVLAQCVHHHRTIMGPMYYRCFSSEGLLKFNKQSLINYSRSKRRKKTKRGCTVSKCQSCLFMIFLCDVVVASPHCVRTSR